MKATEFCYWLQGFFELNDGAPAAISARQAAQIKAHLALVFKHEIDPSYGNLDPKEAQAIHDGTPPGSVKMPAADHSGVVLRC